MVAAEAANPSCPFAQCSADLIQIALFFCLRSCEYTKTNSHRWTFQFILKYMQFHEKEGVIPHNAPTKVFLQSRVVTLFLDTQKNIVRGKSTTMEATDLKHRNPISAAV